jgi:GTP-binding protein HflX
MAVPFERGDVVAYLNEHAAIIDTQYEEEGTLLKVELGKVDYDRFEEFVIGR